jgi:hypothetical protein
MGNRNFKRRKAVEYNCEHLCIVENIDGKDTVYATGQRGESRAELIEHLRLNFGNDNVRVLSDVEHNTLASCKSAWGDRAA